MSWSDLNYSAFKDTAKKTSWQHQKRIIGLCISATLLAFLLILVALKTNSSYEILAAIVSTYVVGIGYLLGVALMMPQGTPSAEILYQFARDNNFNIDPSSKEKWLNLGGDTYTLRDTGITIASGPIVPVSPIIYGTFSGYPFVMTTVRRSSHSLRYRTMRRSKEVGLIRLSLPPRLRLPRLIAFNPPSKVFINAVKDTAYVEELHRVRFEGFTDVKYECYTPFAEANDTFYTLKPLLDAMAKIAPRNLESTEDYFYIFKDGWPQYNLEEMQENFRMLEKASELLDQLVTNSDVTQPWQQR